ncbi:MAG: glutathione peroxidase [Phycisphaerae bacterium]|nr:glutathione peroxidase [Phycisphaerae bacterium]
MNGIDGKPVELSKYAGKVVMIVNVASKCGLTPQYEALQKLYKEHEAAGLVILGFPANNFMNQEPGSDGEILDFCKGKYNVTFPLFSKVSVKGSDAHPLFKQLAGLKPPAGGEPSWNFTKYLVDRRGIAVARFDPKVRPDDPELVKKLKTLLAEPAPKSSPAPAAGPAPAPASTPAPAPGK